MDMDMDIMEIVDMMEEAIEKASAVPLTGKVMIDKGELFRLHSGNSSCIP